MTIRKTLQLEASPSKVWRALTDYREFGSWFQVKLESPFALGKVTRGQMTFPGYEHLKWEVTATEIEFERVFAFEGKADNESASDEPPTLVTFALEKSGTGTKLTLTETGFDKFPPERGLEARAGNEEGWKIQLAALENYLRVQK